MPTQTAPPRFDPRSPFIHMEMLLDYWEWLSHNELEAAGLVLVIAVLYFILVRGRIFNGRN